MEARVVKSFFDREWHRRRVVGEIVEVSPERFAEMNATEFGQLVEAVEEPAVEAESMTTADIKAILSERGVEYRSNAKKSELLDLL